MRCCDLIEALIAGLVQPDWCTRRQAVGWYRQKGIFKAKAGEVLAIGDYVVSDAVPALGTVLPENTAGEQLPTVVRYQHYSVPMPRVGLDGGTGALASTVVAEFGTNSGACTPRFHPERNH